MRVPTTHYHLYTLPHVLLLQESLNIFFKAPENKFKEDYTLLISPEFGHDGTIPKIKYCHPNNHCFIGSKKGGGWAGMQVGNHNQDFAATAGVGALNSRGHSGHTTQLSHLTTEALKASAVCGLKV